jgi:broad specificity polyphosphatase/5'/3'-nucleotidase SurE
MMEDMRTLHEISTSNDGIAMRAIDSDVAGKKKEKERATVIAPKQESSAAIDGLTKRRQCQCRAAQRAYRTYMDLDYEL